MKPVVVMTVIGQTPSQVQPRFHSWAPPPGGTWHFVVHASFADQARAILRLNPRVVVASVELDETIERAERLIERLLAAGVPVVIAIAQSHHPDAESRLRRAGALYLCAHEAAERLNELLESILGSRSPPDEIPAPARRRLRLDAG